MKGVHQEMRARFHKSVENYIIVSRVLQGQDDFRSASAQEKRDVALRLKDVLSKDVLSSIDASKKAKKTSGDEADEEYTGPIPEEEPKTGFWQTKHLSLEERKKLHAMRKAWKKKNENKTAGSTGSTGTAGAATASLGTSSPSTTASSTQLSTQLSTPSIFSAPSMLEPDNEDMEQAIRESVAQTSTGDREEDARIEAQIRVSVQEMRRVAEANRQQQQMRDWKNPALSSSASSVAAPSSSASSVTAVGIAPDWRSTAKGQQQEIAGIPNNISDEEYEALIAEAVRQSMVAQQAAHHHQGQFDETREREEEQHHGIVMTDNTLNPDNSIPTAYELGGNKDDEELTRAMQESMRTAAATAAPSSSSQQQQQPAPAGGEDDGEDEDLKRAMEESARAHREHLARASSERTEEEIIMEYVKKQSLAEEEFRRSKANKGKQSAPADGGQGDDDEDLRRAMEESLKMSGKEGGPSSSSAR